MKCTFATWEHSTIGFPALVLRWHTDSTGKPTDPYYKEHGIIKPWHWDNTYNTCIENEVKRFDTWVRNTFADDPSVQG